MRNRMSGLSEPGSEAVATLACLLLGVVIGRRRPTCGPCDASEESRFANIISC